MDMNLNCPVCDHQDSKVLYKPNLSPGPVSKCQNCGMVYVSKIEDNHAITFEGPVTYGKTDPKICTSANLDDVKDCWEYRYLPGKEKEYPLLRQNALDALERIELHNGKNWAERRILDFGSGWGFFLAVANELGWDTFGIEPLVSGSVYARARFGLNIITDTLRKNTFPKNFFDVITSFQVFEHLPYPKKDMQHLYKFLKKGGIVLIEVPNFETWTMRILRSRHRHFTQDHLNFFSPKTLGRLLSESGFKVIEYYNVTRHMSFAHLFEFWLKKYLPSSLGNFIQVSIENTTLWNKTININFGDILTVIAVKS